MDILQIVDELNQLLQQSCQTLLNQCQQSTFWVANTEETPVRAITIHESSDQLLLDICLADVQLSTLTLQLAQETVLLSGKWAESDPVTGYFEGDRFQSLIPLPFAIHPESVYAELTESGLQLYLPKQGQIQPSRMRIELNSLNFAEPSLSANAMPHAAHSNPR
ncbi:MAG TPA: Hsp20/alpha crystallin family protein [Chroococcidiopsis sp.]